jgi:flavodoxin
MSTVFIVYSTLGGNTELAVKRAVQELEKNDFKVKIKRVDVTNPIEILDYNLTILASPTYGQGSVEQHFEPFLKSMKKLNLAHKKFAVIGLGDTKYYPEYLTESAGILEEAIIQANGELIVPALRIGMPPLKYIDKLIPGWVNKLVKNYSEFKS